MDNLPTLCFATMCKNEELCIRETLESVYKYIDYWIVCDTGSTDKTCEIVKNFFTEKKIPGELFNDEWKGFDINKSLMFERAYNKTDFVLHLDADDFLRGSFNKEILKFNIYDKYNFNYKRGNSFYKATSLYNNRLRWIYVGVAHNLIKCIDKEQPTCSNILTEGDLFIDAEERGFRKFDPNKFLKDAIILKEQFFDTLFNDPHDLNLRSVFYTAQSYYDSQYYKESFQWYNLYTKLKNTWIEEEFESNLRMAQCLIYLNESPIRIVKQMEIAFGLLPDRAEPYYILGKYFNDKRECEAAYNYLSLAKQKNFEEVSNKYLLFVNKFNYGKYVNDELSVACYWTGRGDEGFKYLMEIYNDIEFEHLREHLDYNKQCFIKKYGN